MDETKTTTTKNQTRTNDLLTLLDIAPIPDDKIYDDEDTNDQDCRIYQRIRNHKQVKNNIRTMNDDIVNNRNTVISTNANNIDTAVASNNVDDYYERCWKESAFAVGFTYPTWKEEVHETIRFARSPNDQETTRRTIIPSSMTCTSSICYICCLCASRVGNMIVLKQNYRNPTEEVTTVNNSVNNGSGDAPDSRIPVLQCVLGPHWMVLCFVTLPIFILSVVYVAMKEIQDDNNIYVILSWSICHGVLFFSLFNVSFRDRGILYRHATEPLSQNTNDIEVGTNVSNTTPNPNKWVWNDQALTYRPQYARYSNECGVVINGYDHVCPWTGTAIGQNNIMWFNLFVTFVFVVLIYDAVLLSLP